MKPPRSRGHNRPFDTDDPLVLKINAARMHAELLPEKHLSRGHASGGRADACAAAADAVHGTYLFGGATNEEKSGVNPRLTDTQLTGQWRGISTSLPWASLDHQSPITTDPTSPRRWARLRNAAGCFRELSPASSSNACLTSIPTPIRCA